MKVKINALNAMEIGGNIILNISIPSKFKNAVESFVNGFNAANDYELKRVTKKRSLSANGYAWALMDEIAAALRITKEEVYRKAINDVGVFTEMRFKDAEAARRFKPIWQANGMGWLTKTIDDTTVYAYYGSSSYDTAEMARLIDYIVDEAKRLHIETLPPDRLEIMKTEWGRK